MASTIDVLEQVAHGPRNEVPTNLSTQEDTIAALVRELFYRAREARRPLFQQWKRNYKVLNMRDYKMGANPWDEEPAVSNVWPVVASATAWMTDQRPTLETAPSAEPFSPYWDYYQRLSQDMNVVLNSVFQNYALDAEINKFLWDIYTYGIGYFKTQWEAPLADGLGDTVFRRVDPATIYPDPHARSMAELTYIIEAKTMTISDADRAWPGAARKLQAEFLEEVDESPHKLDQSVQPNQPRAAIGALSATGYTTNNVSSVGSNPTQHAGRLTDMPVVTVLEAYVRGYLIEESDDEGVSKVTDQWRCIVTCGNQILMDSPCDEINAFNNHPYDRGVLFDTGEWYGPCIVELLAPIQRLINWLLGAINRNIYLMGNPVLVEDMRSASRNKRFTNKPGQRLEGTLNAIGWLSPPQIHPQMSVDLVRYYESKIETISGLSAMVRGFSPTGRNAQGVLDSVQDAAFVRVRASLRELERSLRGVGSKMCATIAEFYTEPRLMSIIGDDGQRTYRNLRARHFYAIDADNPDNRIPLRFSLIADAGSQLPTSKQARAAEAKHLFQLGAIDVYELLKAMQWPNYALVAQRVMQQQAMAAANAGTSKSVSVGMSA